MPRPQSAADVVSIAALQNNPAVRAVTDAYPSYLAFIDREHRYRFANEAYTGEMCIQFGNVAGGRLGLPGIAQGPMPPEATK